MELVQWDSSFSVKVHRYDEDHKKLFAMINTLHESMKAGKSRERIQQIVKQLADYTKYHFSAEEAQLERTKYPGLNAHRTEHQGFIHKIEQFQRELAIGNANISVSVSMFLNDWLFHHIRQTDQQYSSYLNEHGVS